MDFKNSKLYFNPENVQGAVLETNQLLHKILGDISLCKKIMKTTIIPLYSGEHLVLFIYTRSTLNREPSCMLARMFANPKSLKPGSTDSSGAFLIDR